LDAIRARRNVRQYQDRPIDPHDLDRILEAGRRSPSASNRQRWDFVVCTDRRRHAAGPVRRRRCPWRRHRIMLGSAQNGMLMNGEL
jgi:nitroreductase